MATPLCLQASSAGKRPAFEASACRSVSAPRESTSASTTRTRQPARRNVAALAGAQQLDGPGPAALATTSELEIREGVFEGFWEWRGYRIRYHRCGDSGPPAVLVHGERPPARRRRCARCRACRVPQPGAGAGAPRLWPSRPCAGFGGNADHWRKNLPALGGRCRVWAVDLLGYGFSDKPSPRGAPPNSIYNFENWGAQLRDFAAAAAPGEKVFYICNSGAHMGGGLGGGGRGAEQQGGLPQGGSACCACLRTAGVPPRASVPPRRRLTAAAAPPPFPRRSWRPGGPAGGDRRS
jgi:hypothetical protein